MNPETPRRLAKLLRRPWRIIPDDEGGDYLFRLFLTPVGDWWRTRLPGMFLHYFYRSDHDREYHNHPWPWSLSFVFGGGYTEYRKDGRYAPVREFILRPGRMNIIWKDTFHRVELHDEKAGCLTLLIVAPRPAQSKDAESNWGFVPADGSTYESNTARDRRLGRVYSASDDE